MAFKSLRCSVRVLGTCCTACDVAEERMTDDATAEVLLTGRTACFEDDVDDFFVVVTVGRRLAEAEFVTEACMLPATLEGVLVLVALCVEEPCPPRT